MLKGGNFMLEWCMTKEGDIQLQPVIGSSRTVCSGLFVVHLVLSHLFSLSSFFFCAPYYYPFKTNLDTKYQKACS